MSSLLKHLKPPRSLRFTRLGTYVVLLALAIGLAAMNTGNNLVYMIFGLVLGFITASGVLSEMSLRQLDVDWILPSEIYADTPAILQLIVRNQKKKLPSFAIEVTMVLRCHDSPPHPRPPRSRQGGSGLHPLPPYGGRGEHQGAGEGLSAFFLFLPAGKQQTVKLEFVLKKRGEFEIKEIKIETQFPFGFFRKYLVRSVEQIFVVYPKIEHIKTKVMELLRKEEQSPMFLKGFGESFWGLKSFSEGDNPRQISWKASARQNRLMVRETEREIEKKVWIDLGSMQDWQNLNAKDLESAVSFTASFIVEQFRNGFAVGFLAPGYVLEPSMHRKSLREMLRYLAVFEPHLSSLDVPMIHREQRRGTADVTLQILQLWRKLQNDAPRP